MQFKDAIYPTDTIEASIYKDGNFINIEMDDTGIGRVYLTKEDAAAFGRLLIELSESI